MQRTYVGVALSALLLGWGVVAAVETGTEPLDLGTTEQAAVRLVLMDVVVVDGKGATVSGLGMEDFEAVYRGNPARIDTLDVDCRAGALPDPVAVGPKGKRAPIPASESVRRSVLLFDYMHLATGSRERALVHAEKLIGEMSGRQDEIMIAALTGGLRIEHGFSSDRDSLLSTVDRMRHDISLWNGNFAHLNELGFVGGMKGLMTVLEEVPGRKSLVMFSGMQDVPLDNQFSEIAALAANSRCSIYPIDTRGMFAEEGFFDEIETFENMAEAEG
ncbi:hypothetical protein ABI59_10135 [Acidobacteria bacterium Mor1]|nr:hypothetical protein ABI59_10135 [Acidobacteria bacterium Mor1]